MSRVGGRWGRRFGTVALLSVGMITAYECADGQAVDTGLITAARGLSAGSSVSVLTLESGLRTGTFLGVNEVGIVLEEASGQVSAIALDEVTEFSHRRRRWRRGLWIGVGTGVVLTGLVAAFSEGCGPGCSAGTDLAVTGAIWTLTFGTAGTLIGSTLWEWRVAYRR